MQWIIMRVFQEENVSKSSFSMRTLDNIKLDREKEIECTKRIHKFSVYFYDLLMDRYSSSLKTVL